jgi:hypothetical protein
MIRRALLFFFLLVVPALHAQDLSGYEKILLPAYSVEPTLGLGGLFITQLYAFSERAFRYFPAPQESAGNPSFRTQQALDPFPSFYANPRATRGLLLFIDRAVSGDVELAYEVQVQPHEAGFVSVTRLPVVREHEFLTGRSTIAGPPSNSGQHNHLRIYDVDLAGNMRVHMRIRTMWPSPGTVIDERDLDVNARDGTAIVHPYYTEILLPQCPCNDARLLIELEPFTAGRYYAFVSSTTNTTQAITIYPPRQR